MDDDTAMDEPGNENGVEIARPEPDAAAASWVKLLCAEYSLLTSLTPGVVDVTA